MKIILYLTLVAFFAGVLFIGLPVIKEICAVTQEKTSVDQLVQYIQQNDPKGWLMSCFGNGEVGVEYFGSDCIKAQTWGKGVWGYEGRPSEVLEEMQKGIWR